MDQLPALSWQVPLSVTAVVSGPLYVSGEVQEAIPEVESVPLQVRVTPERYQPAAFGARLGATVVEGGVASTLSSFVVTDVVPPSLVAEQVRVVPVFGSSIRIAGSQPVVERMGPSGSLTAQWTTMNLPLALPVYQLLFPGVPSME